MLKSVTSLITPWSNACLRIKEKREELEVARDKWMFLKNASRKKIKLNKKNIKTILNCEHLRKLTFYFFHDLKIEKNFI